MFPCSPVLQALQCLHTHGLVHGDVRTANFCTAYQPSEGSKDSSAVYLLDLAFAKDFTRLSGEGHACCMRPAATASKPVLSQQPAGFMAVIHIFIKLTGVWQQLQVQPFADCMQCAGIRAFAGSCRSVLSAA
jgi:hypothetical protein